MERKLIPGESLTNQRTSYRNHVKEERTVIGGVELARKTVVAADNQG